jgi:hypothetical protein
VYGVVFSAGLYYLLTVARRGPDGDDQAGEQEMPMTTWFRRLNGRSG